MIQNIEQTLDHYSFAVHPHGADMRDSLSPIQRKAGVTSLFDDLKEAGLDPQTTVLQYNMESADAEIAALLECSDTEDVVHIKRLRYSRGRPSPSSATSFWHPRRRAKTASPRLDCTSS